MRNKYEQTKAIEWNRERFQRFLEDYANHFCDGKPPWSIDWHMHQFDQLKPGEWTGWRMSWGADIIKQGKDGDEQ